MEANSKQSLNPSLGRFMQKLNLPIIRTYAGSIITECPVTPLLAALSPITAFYPPFQRELDVDRVSRLVKEQMEEFKQKQGYGIVHAPIVLDHCHTLANPINPEGIFIVDGNHRLNVLSELIKFTPRQLDNVILPIRIYQADSLMDLQQYYIKINKNYEPHLLYELDDLIKQVIDHIVAWFGNSFDVTFFSKSARPNRPNLTTKQLTAELSNSKRVRELIETCGGDAVGCAQSICDKFAAHNHMLSQNNFTFFMDNQTDKERASCFNAHKKCVLAAKPLYLGLLRNYFWIDEALKPERVKVVIKPRTATLIDL